MKKILALFLCLMLLLSGCTYRGRSEVDSYPHPAAESEVLFKARYIRTNSSEERDYPSVYVMRSADDLAAYCERYKKVYDFDSGWDGDPFNDVIKRYDTAYFEDQVLLMVLLQEPSGSNRHRVTALSKTFYGEIVIDIETQLPESGTDDMAEWHILLEGEEGFSVPENALLRLRLDGEEYPLYERVEYQNGVVNMALNKLPGWAYEIIEKEQNFGIRFRPAAEPEGHITLWYQTQGFGVCGTGLSTKERTIGKWTVSQGTYDENPHWDYLYFKDAPGDYCFLTEGDLSWWDKYEEELETIVGTALVAQNCVGEGHIREIAENYDDEYKIVYEDYTVDFDHSTGLWTVVYQKDKKPVHTLQIRANGAILE